MAFNAKNLTYDKSEPAFLQRLKAGYASQDGRNNVQHARPGKSRLKMGDGDEDDGPVILDEKGEVVRKDVYEGMLKGDQPKEELDGHAVAKGEGEADQKKNDDAVEREVQKVAEIGAGKKRKAIKVVGSDEGEESKEDSTSSKSLERNAGPKDDLEKRPKTDKPKKKAKKIKLSFDEPE